MSARLARVLALAWTMACGIAAPTRAQADEPVPAPADSLSRYLGRMADSTNTYFGISAAPLDTAGLDSAEAAPIPPPPRPRASFSLLPSFAFSRVDGPIPGATLRFEPARHPLGTLGLKLAYAMGSHTTLGGADYAAYLKRGDAHWIPRLWAGRAPASMNRDHLEPVLNTLRAFLFGNDYTHYYRVDGFRAQLERQGTATDLTFGYRNMMESPLTTTATWNLFKRTPAVIGNLAAAGGRAQEFEVYGDHRVSVLPFLLEGSYQTSGSAIGSAFTYDRWRLAAGGDLALGRWLALVPQVAYGISKGDALPQTAFYLGGGPTLRRLNRDILGGTGLAIGRLDLLVVRDVLAAASVPHPDALPIQGGVFLSSGAVWGRDPYTGGTRPGNNWPDRRGWLSETGIQLDYDFGPFGTVLRASEVWPIGPGTHHPMFVVQITRVLDLLHRSLTD
jgi:hypothetical protein